MIEDLINIILILVVAKLLSQAVIALTGTTYDLINFYLIILVMWRLGVRGESRD